MDCNVDPATALTPISYADIATIALTAATVVLAGVAIIVGLAAVFGFQFIRSQSVATAEQTVHDRLDESLDAKVDEAILDRLRPRLDEIVAKEIDEVLDRDRVARVIAEVIYGDQVDSESEDDPEKGEER